MKKLLPVMLALALVVPTVTQWPKGCIYSCEGWLFGYAGKRPDHLDDFNYFVSSKEAKTIDEAKKIADRKVLKKQ